MLTFHYDIGGKTSEIMKLNGKVVGYICRTDGGFQYRPKGSKTGGDVFPSIFAVRKSLRG